MIINPLQQIVEYDYGFHFECIMHIPGTVDVTIAVMNLSKGGRCNRRL